MATVPTTDGMASESIPPEGNAVAITAAQSSSSIAPPPALPAIEEQIFQRILARLQTLQMGATTAPIPPTAPSSVREQEAQSVHESEAPEEPQWHTDDQNWHSWWDSNTQYWSWEQTDSTWGDWKSKMKNGTAHTSLTWTFQSLMAAKKNSLTTSMWS